MVKLKIDNIEAEVSAETTILNAAKSVGIDIPSMCYVDGYCNSPACMVCIVKDNISGKLMPSCALKVTEGMDICTTDAEVYASRKDSLELLFSEHVGDCEAPCRNGCPAFMNIPLMNRHIAAGDFTEALKVVKQHIALPYTLGYVCSAPCEKICRRKDADSPVAICQLKKSAAAYVSKDELLAAKEKSSGKSVVIVGAGATGLAAAYYSILNGHKCVVYDANSAAGGALRSTTDESVLPKQVLNQEIQSLVELGVEFILDTRVTKQMLEDSLKPNFDAIIIATGEVSEDDSRSLSLERSKFGLVADPKLFTTPDSKIFAAGSIVRKQKMAVKLVAQGKSVANMVDLFLKGDNIIFQEKEFNCRFGKLMPEEISEYLTEAHERSIVAPTEGSPLSYTAQEAIAEAQRCMHCDCRKVTSCKLRNYADKYSIDRTKYAFDDRKPVTKITHHDFVIYEPEKCIRCGLCVDITEKNNELTGLTFIGRGFDVRIDIPFNAELNSALTITAEKCIKHCPTGALSRK